MKFFQSEDMQSAPSDPDITNLLKDLIADGRPIFQPMHDDVSFFIVFISRRYHSCRFECAYSFLLYVIALSKSEMTAGRRIMKDLS